MYWNVLKIQFFSFNIQAVINLLEYLNKLACRASLWDSVKWRPSFSFVWLSSTLSKCNQKREKQGASGAMVTLFYQLHSREKSLLKHISSDFLVHTNVFLKIQNMHTLASLDLNAEHCDSLTVRCLCDFFCALLLWDQHFVSGIVPCLYSGGLDFWLKWLCWDVCDRAHPSYLSHEERRPIPASTRAGSERSARQWSNCALHTQAHT